MEKLVVKSIDESYDDLVKGRGPDKQPRKKRFSKQQIESIRNELKQTSRQIDEIVQQGGRVDLRDPLSVKFNSLRSKLRSAGVVKSIDESYDDLAKGRGKDKVKRKRKPFSMVEFEKRFREKHGWTPPGIATDPVSFKAYEKWAEGHKKVYGNKYHKDK